MNAEPPITRFQHGASTAVTRLCQTLGATSIVKEEPKPRYPTKSAITSLAKKLGLEKPEPNSQDWEYEIANPQEIDTYIRLYESPETNDDEKFVIMETIIQSFEELDNLNTDKRWKYVLEILKTNMKLHEYTIWYWAKPDSNEIASHWRVTPSIRGLIS